MNIPITYLNAAIAALTYDDDPIEASRLIRLAQIHLTGEFVQTQPALETGGDFSAAYYDALEVPTEPLTFALECPPMRRKLRGLLERWS